LDVVKAIKEEIGREPDLIPPQLVDAAVAGEEETVSAYFLALAASGRALDAGRVISANKWRYGRRPVAFLPLYERVLYRAVVNSLGDELVPRDRSTKAYAEWQNAPLQETDVKFVVATDLSNYYTSLNLDRLASQLVSRTGYWASIVWLKEFWSVTSAGYGGIPQVSEPSDRIADTFADELHRSVARRGVHCWRFADDFVFACTSYSDAVAALETFDEQSRSFGLVVNERKTYILPVDRYRAHISGEHALFADVAAEVRENLTMVNVYSWSEVEPEDAEVAVGAAEQVLRIWSEEQEPHSHVSPITVDLSRLLRTSLTVLRSANSDAGLEYLHEILRREPQLTPSVCRYLLSLKENPGAGQAVERITKSLALNRWQTMWLLYSISDKRFESTREVRAWTRSTLGNASDVVSSAAAWAMACQGGLSVREWCKVPLNNTTMPALMGSLSVFRITDPDAITRFEATDPLAKLVKDYVLREDLASPWPF
jgi:hypothetical protein